MGLEAMSEFSEDVAGAGAVAVDASGYGAAGGEGAGAGGRYMANQTVALRRFRVTTLAIPCAGILMAPMPIQTL